MSTEFNSNPGDEEKNDDSYSEVVENDGTPVPDEDDLEQNDLSDVDAKQVVSDDPHQKKGSSGPEEKDFTD